MKHDPSYKFDVEESLPQCSCFLDQRSDARVHEARKRIKKLRAVLVLVAGGIGRDSSFWCCARRIEHGASALGLPKEAAGRNQELHT
jgi:hypothetical protein